jgi:hypothetical protein
VHRGRRACITSGVLLGTDHLGSDTRVSLLGLLNHRRTGHLRLSNTSVGGGSIEVGRLNGLLPDTIVAAAEESDAEPEKGGGVSPGRKPCQVGEGLDGLDFVTKGADICCGHVDKRMFRGN